MFDPILAHFTRLSQESSCNVGVLFLNEVAMGDMYVMHSHDEISSYGTKAPGGKQSTWAIGHSEPGIEGIEYNLIWWC